MRVILGGEVVAESVRSRRVLETSHPPVYYIPLEDVRPEALVRTECRTFCEFKGTASYWSVRSGDRVAESAAWCYPEPSPGYESLRDHVAFYPGRMDECTLDGERVNAQAGDFYGGWITAEVRGPFKGEPGTQGW